jgi:hypothetical protein
MWMHKILWCLLLFNYKYHYKTYIPKLLKIYLYDRLKRSLTRTNWNKPFPNVIDFPWHFLCNTCLWFCLRGSVERVCAPTFWAPGKTKILYVSLTNPSPLLPNMPDLNRIWSPSDATACLDKFKRRRYTCISLLHANIGIHSFMEGYLEQRPQSVWSLCPTEHLTTFGVPGSMFFFLCKLHFCFPIYIDEHVKFTTREESRWPGIYFSKMAAPCFDLLFQQMSVILT